MELERSALVSGHTPAAAGTCDTIGGTTYCGTVVNNTPWTMTTTETINTGPNWCNFANYGSGNIRCTQVDLGPWGSRGGSHPVDVDGFTYNYNDFYMGGVYYTRGVWIKFASNRTIRCRDGVAGANRPWCEG